MRENTALPIKKSFLYCLIVSVAIAAAVGISAILSGEFGSVEIRILLTTLTVSAGSMCGLACWAYLASRRGKILPLAGIVLTFVGSSMILIGIWGEVDSKEFWKVTASASVFAVACAHLALLSLARLAQWFQWSLSSLTSWSSVSPRSSSTSSWARSRRGACTALSPKR